MIHHPQKELIEKYSSGELFTHLALMVSHHLDVCEECELIHKKNLEKNSNHFSAGSTDLSEKELDSAFDFVMRKVAEHPDDLKHETERKKITINVSGQLIYLPRSMNFLRDMQISWKAFGMRSAIAPVVMSSHGNFYLIYIGPGEHVPLHHHTGIEYSYVVSGSYEDGISTFHTGDFSISTHEVTHSPHATSKDGCFVISWIEGRLDYLDGFWRPLNPILWWYLHRA
jgi:putative transcriptional regulator